MIDTDISKWLEEDIPLWDVSAQIIPNEKTSAKIIAKEEGIICGLEVVNRIFSKFDINFVSKYSDGDHVIKGSEIAVVHGYSKGILQAERVSLNILSHLSGIATLTYKFQELLRKTNPKIKIASTRKTLPGLRKYEKWAIQCGGGDTHRTSLSDMVMLKENHIAAVGGISKAITEIRKYISFSTKIEIEVRNFQEAEEAAKCKPDIIMLDNFKLNDLETTIRIIRSLSPHTLIEVSGNVTEKTLPSYASFDIDVISSGKLTHSVNAFDVSLLLDSVEL